MDPPPSRIAPTKRRTPSALRNPTTLSQSFMPQGSPSLFSSGSMHMQDSVEAQSSRPKNQIVSVSWEDDMISRHTSTLQIGVAECVETKTVTTTTTTKRSYPPLLIRQQSLDALDAKEYPLASRPTPLELVNFSYEVGHRDADRIRPLIKEDRVNKASQSPSRLKFHRSNTSKDGRGNERQIQQENMIQGLRAEKLSQRLSLINQRKLENVLVDLRTSSKPGNGKLRRSQKIPSSRLLEDDADSDTYTEGSFRPIGLAAQILEEGSFPATPDLSELDMSSSSRVRPSSASISDSRNTPRFRLGESEYNEEVVGRSETSNLYSFANAVATPPIAESDLEPLTSSNLGFAQSNAPRSGITTLSDVNASLPSPGLSPTYETEQEIFPESDEEDGADIPSPTTQSDQSQDTFKSEGSSGLSRSQLVGHLKPRKGNSLTTLQSPNMLEPQTMVDNFAAMPSEMQTLMIFQFLRMCDRKTLHFVANTVNPALKCDFLDQLPLELSLHILNFLNRQDLCRATQVSRQWRNIIDSDETGWKELFDRDGFVLPAGELDRAIRQGWGWQDPYGLDGCEEDISPLSSEAMTTEKKKIEATPSRRGRSATSKRKRVPRDSHTERHKRRAVGHEFAEKASGMLAQYPQGAKSHKIEGPLSAANAAAIAVPNPGRGLPSLQKLHLFKSLYRRHYMLQNSWMSGKVAPHHFAFHAHPLHVITCLQFDDDKILTGSDDTLIHVYNTKTGKLRRKLEGHEGGVWALQYEGNVLVSGSTDRSVRVWDIEKGICTQVFYGHTSTVRCLQILMPEMTGRFDNGKPVMMPEKPLIITGSRDSQLRVWNLPEQGSKRYIAPANQAANDNDCPFFVRVLTGHTHSVRAIAAHQDTLVSGSYDNTVRVWNISTGETVHRLQGHLQKVYSVVLDHKRDRCISGSMDNYVKIWSLETGACLFTLEGHNSLVGLLDLRDERLVSAAADATLRIWDPENGQCKSTLSAHTGAITCFQHDGQKVISGSDRTLKLWNIKTGECITDLLSNLSGVWQVKFDERRCVAAVQRDSITYVEVLDFGASRDGIPARERGARRVLTEAVTNEIVISDDDEPL